MTAPDSSPPYEPVTDESPATEMTTPGLVTPDRCPTCGNRGVDTWHLSRCAYQSDLRQRLTDRAHERGVEPRLALDLWAHLRNIGDDGTLALERALTVIDLGWRPVVGVSSNQEPIVTVEAGAVL